MDQDTEKTLDEKLEHLDALHWNVQSYALKVQQYATDGQWGYAGKYAQELAQCAKELDDYITDMQEAGEIE